MEKVFTNNVKEIILDLQEEEEPQQDVIEYYDYFIRNVLQPKQEQILNQLEN